MALSSLQKSPFERSRNMIKIMIADDQELIRESLKIILSTNPEFKIIDLLANGNEVLESIKKDVPDVILMDVRMPEMDGVTCTKIVKKTHPYTNVIVLTTFDDDEYIYNALKFGASGYLLKGVSLEELSEAIYTVQEGGSIIHPRVATKAFRLFSDMANNASKKGEIINSTGDVNDLSNTEWKVIDKVSQGMSNKEISAQLHFSEGTIRNYLSVILDKLQLRDRTQLAIWYIQSGEEWYRKKQEAQ